jgi:cytochrome c
MESAKYLALAAAIALGVAVIMGLSFVNAYGAGNDAGAAVYNKKCLSCHPVKEGAHKLGPSLAGMFGRKAGTVAGYTKYRGSFSGRERPWFTS